MSDLLLVRTNENFNYFKKLLYNTINWERVLFKELNLKPEKE